MIETQTNQKLLEFKDDNRSQKEIVFDLFVRYPEFYMTAYQVKGIIEVITGKQYPLGSIRRAVTELTNEGRLEKTEKRRKHERANHYWTLKDWK